MKQRREEEEDQKRRVATFERIDDSTQTSPLFVSCFKIWKRGLIVVALLLTPFLLPLSQMLNLISPISPKVFFLCL